MYTNPEDSIFHDLMELEVPKSLLKWIRSVVFDPERFDMNIREQYLSSCDDDDIAISLYECSYYTNHGYHGYDGYNDLYRDIEIFVRQHGNEYEKLSHEIRRVCNKYNWTTLKFVTEGLENIESWWYYNNNAVDLDCELLPLWQFIYYKCQSIFSNKNESLTPDDDDDNSNDSNHSSNTNDKKVKKKTKASDTL